MPLRPCRHPTCTVYVSRQDIYCPEHADQSRAEQAERQRYYNQHTRDQEAARFYGSTAWQVARLNKLAKFPVCQRCRHAWATTVHHIVPLRQCSPEQRTDDKNLMALCASCHSAIEREARQ